MTSEKAKKEAKEFWDYWNREFCKSDTHHNQKKKTNERKNYNKFFQTGFESFFESFESYVNKINLSFNDFLNIEKDEYLKLDGTYMNYGDQPQIYMTLNKKRRYKKPEFEMKYLMNLELSNQDIIIDAYSSRKETCIIGHALKCTYSDKVLEDFIALHKMTKYIQTKHNLKWDKKKLFLRYPNYGGVLLNYDKDAVRNVLLDIKENFDIKVTLQKVNM